MGGETPAIFSFHKEPYHNLHDIQKFRAGIKEVNPLGWLLIFRFSFQGHAGFGLWDF